MRVKIFCRKQSLWTAALHTTALEQEVNQWLAAHSTIKVVEVKHDVAGSLWSVTQFIISIYYSE